MNIFSKMIEFVSNHYLMLLIIFGGLHAMYTMFGRRQKYIVGLFVIIMLIVFSTTITTIFTEQKNESENKNIPIFESGETIDEKFDWEENETQIGEPFAWEEQKEYDWSDTDDLGFLE